MDKAVVVSGDVQGNITSCKIENQLLSVKRNSVFSLQEVKTYITYDVCNKQELARYTYPELTGFSVMSMVIGLTFLLLIVSAWASSDSVF